MPKKNGTLTLHAVAEPTRKRRGEAAEAAFLARATHLGFSVCIPWGDSDRYDSVVELDRGFLRVQVKSAALYAETRYRVKTTGANGKVYTSKEIDFFVGYIVPENIWYIIPIQAIGRRKGHPLLSPHPPPVPRHVRKIPRSLVPPRFPPKRPPPQRPPQPLPQQESGSPLRPLPPTRLSSVVTDKTYAECDARVGRTLLSDAFDVAVDLAFALLLILFLNFSPVSRKWPSIYSTENTNTAACFRTTKKQEEQFSSHSVKAIAYL